MSGGTLFERMSAIAAQAKADRDRTPKIPASGSDATEGGQHMAQKAKPGDGGGVTNLSETKEVIREAVSKIIKLKGDRKEINAAIGEQRARVKNYGVPPAALDLALRMKEADPEDRQKHDEGYAIARDALGLGLQRSLFEMIEEPAGEPAPQTGPDATDQTAEEDAPNKPIPITDALDKAREHMYGDKDRDGLTGAGSAPEVPDAA